MQMKIVEDAVRKYGNLPEVQRVLTRLGINISHTALHNAFSGKTKTLRSDVEAKLVDLVYGGDWTKLGRARKADLEGDK